MSFQEQMMRERIAIYCDAGKRACMTEKELACSPTLQEIFDALHGEVVHGRRLTDSDIH